MRQLAYGVALDSDLVLGVTATDHPAEVTVRRLPGQVNPAAITWLDRDSDPWMTAGQVGGNFYLRFGDEAEFLVGTDGRSLRWHAFADGTTDTLIHLLLDHVLPRALTRLDRIVLHGSCVALDERGCVAIIGRSGSGKSTLAASLMTRGCCVVADDCVVVQRQGGVPLVAPAYPGLRLTDSSVRMCGAHGLELLGSVSRFSEKTRMRPTGGGAAPVEARYPLLAVVALPHPDDEHDESASAPSLVELAPAAAGIELLRHSFHLNAVGERAALLRQVLPLAAGSPVLRLRYGHSVSGLERALRDVGSLLGMVQGATG